MLRKKLLFINRHAPYGSSLAKDALDAILTTAAYDQDLSVLFMDDGVFQLVKQQSSADIQQKNFAAMLPALALYEVNSIFVHKESLATRQLSLNDLILDGVQLIDSQAISGLLARQDQLLSF